MSIINGFFIHVVLKVFNYSGEGSIILWRNNLGGAKPNQDQHGGDS